MLAAKDQVAAQDDILCGHVYQAGRRRVAACVDNVYLGVSFKKNQSLCERDVRHSRLPVGIVGILFEELIDLVEHLVTAIELHSVPGLVVGDERHLKETSANDAGLIIICLDQGNDRFLCHFCNLCSPILDIAGKHRHVNTYHTYTCGDKPHVSALVLGFGIYLGGHLYHFNVLRCVGVGYLPQSRILDLPDRMIQDLIHRCSLRRASLCKRRVAASPTAN